MFSQTIVSPICLRSRTADFNIDGGAGEADAVDQCNSDGVGVSVCGEGRAKIRDTEAWAE